MASLDTFGKRMQARADRIRLARNKLVGDVGVTVLRKVAFRTPYATGRARSNWIVQLDSRAKYSYFANSYGGAFGANNAVARGTPVAISYNGKLNTSLHITNNLVYIVPLNEGHSDQAPSGYVQKEMLAAVRLVVARYRLGD